MRWPVARSVHDDVVADLRKRLDDSEAARAKLTRIVVKMKVSGAIIPRAIGAARLEQRERGEIERAIDENPIAQNDSRLRRHLAAWARKQQQLNIPDEEILEKLRTWHLVSATDEDDGEEDDDDEVIAV